MCRFSLCCFCPVEIVWLVKEKYLGEKPFSNRSVTSAEVMGGNESSESHHWTLCKGKYMVFRCKVSQSGFLSC